MESSSWATGSRKASWRKWLLRWCLNNKEVSAESEKWKRPFGASGMCKDPETWNGLTHRKTAFCLLYKGCMLKNGRKQGQKGVANGQNRNGLSTRLNDLNVLLRAGGAIEGLIAGKWQVRFVLWTEYSGGLVEGILEQGQNGTRSPVQMPLWWPDLDVMSWGKA